jgi:hypothetical protein
MPLVFCSDQAYAAILVYFLLLSLLKYTVSTVSPVLNKDGIFKLLMRPVAGVLDKPYSQLIPLSRVAVQARQSIQAGTVSILCSLAGLYG